MKTKVLEAGRGFRLSIGSLSAWIGIAVMVILFVPSVPFQVEAKHLFIGFEQGKPRGSIRGMGVP
jgi:hypothetical protein